MSAPSAAASSSSSAFVFPVLVEDKDFIISNFIEDEAAAVASASAAEAAEDFELPFGNIPRGERIGRIADWTGASADAAQQRGPGGRRQAAITNTHQKTEEEAEGWSLSLGHANALASQGGHRRGNLAAKPARAAQPFGGPSAPGARTGGYQQKDSYGRGGAPGGRRYGSWNRPADRIREPSIKVGTEWKLVEEIEFSRLAKVQINVEDPEILASFGSATIYDRSFDKLKAKAERTYSGAAASIPAPISASDDSFIKGCAQKGEATIYTTDAVASLLMACQRTVQPWDIIVRRRGQAVFFDVRPESRIHLVNVGENAGEAAPEDANPDAINSQLSLASEATKINLGLPAFFGKGQEVVALGDAADASIGHAYRYSKFDLGGTSMIVRSEIGNALDKDSLTLSKAFLEYDHASFGWRSKLDTSRGAVLAHEIKHNGAMLSRWVYQALYSGASTLKLAYVSRVAPKNPTRHVILGVHDQNPYDLATQMSLNVANGFGVVRALADLCLGQADNADYALVRDANKPMLRLYALP